MTQKTVKNTPSSKCPGPENDERQMCALPEDRLQMDPNDIIGDPWFEKVCEEEFSNIADDCYMATPGLKKFVKRSLATLQMTVMKVQTVCWEASTAMNAALKKLY